MWWEIKTSGKYGCNLPKNAPEVQKDLKYYLFYKLDPKLELKLWGLIIIAFAIAELVFVYFAVLVDGPFS